MKKLIKKNLIFITAPKIIPLLIVLAISISCSSQIKNTGLNYEKEYEIILNDVKLDPTLDKLIKETKSQFEKDFSMKPMVIILFIYEKDNSRLISIENRSMLYLNSNEKLILNDSFIGGTNIDGSIILVKSNKTELYKDLIKISPKLIQFKLYYSNHMGFCENIYKVLDKEFLHIDNLCSYNLFTE